MNQKLAPGLYIVATPIGNLGDLTPRAADVLTRADVLAVEDSRVTGKLLQHLGVRRSMTAYHDHSSEDARAALVARMGAESVALCSDAGTPLISDPGYKLVRDARAAGHDVVTIPGACAAVAALTLAGLPTDRFLFAGFLPAKAKARDDAIAGLAHVPATLVFYETAPRLAASLAALAAGLGDREAAVAREVTKLHEECVTGTLGKLADRYAANATRGEIVLVVAPPAERSAPVDVDGALADALLTMSVGGAASEVAAATGIDRRTLYARALEIKGELQNR